ncbi:MAG: alpha-L-rhamnosidase C-terminal domain-containing protein, partial [bacterium]
TSLLIVPGIGKGVDWAKGSLPAGGGMAEVSWDYKPQRFTLTLRLPACVKARVALPRKVHDIYALNFAGAPPPDRIDCVGNVRIQVMPGIWTKE